MPEGTKRGEIFCETQQFALHIITQPPPDCNHKIRFHFWVKILKWRGEVGILEGERGWVWLSGGSKKFWVVGANVEGGNASCEAVPPVHLQEFAAFVKVSAAALAVESFAFHSKSAPRAARDGCEFEKVCTQNDFKKRARAAGVTGVTLGFAQTHQGT